MRKNTTSLLFVSVMIILLATLSYCSKTNYVDKKMITKAFNTPDIVSLFAVTVDDINKKTLLYIAQAKNSIDDIIAVPDDQRTYENTARLFDEVVSLSDLAIAQRVYEALELLSPDADIRNAAHDAYITIQSFWVDHVTSNKALYNAFMAYEAATIEYENLSAQQRYFIVNTMDDFKREGLSLSDEKLAQVNVLRKELAALCADFDRNIAQDNRSINVTKEELIGLDDDFINTLAHTDDNFYVLGVDYPTYYRVMENCSIAQT